MAGRQVRSWRASDTSNAVRFAHARPSDTSNAFNPLPPGQDDGIVVWMVWVYIARCADDTLYIGHTTDLVAREQAHNDGFGGTYTSARRPVRIVFSESHSLQSAIARERQLKRWTKAKKEALVAGDRAALKRLFRCRASD